MAKHSLKRTAPSAAENHSPATLVRSQTERLVLGALLLYPPDDTRGWLEVSDFALFDHRLVFQAIEAHFERREPVSCPGVYEYLQNHGGRHLTLSWLVTLIEGIPRLTPAHFEHYARLLREATRRRRLATLAQDVALAVEAGLPLERLAPEFEQRLGALARPPETGELPEAVGDVWSQESHTTYLVEDFIAERSITMISGESGDGKSMVGLALAASIAQGFAFLGRRTISRPVLYLDREMPLYVVKDRMFLLGIPRLYPRMRVWGGWESVEAPAPESPLLASFARREKPLLIFDPLVRNLNGADENDAAQIRLRMNHYRKLTEAGATVVLNHHRSEKSESDYRGSSDFRAAVDSAWRLSREDGTSAGDALGKLVLTPYKLRAAPSKPIRFEYQDGRFVPLDGPSRPPAEIVQDLVRIYPGSTQQELIRHAVTHGLGKDRVRIALEGLILDGSIEARTSAHNTRRHYLRVQLLNGHDPVFGGGPN